MNDFEKMVIAMAALAADINQPARPKSTTAPPQKQSVQPIPPKPLNGKDNGHKPTHYFSF